MSTISDAIKKARTVIFLLELMAKGQVLRWGTKGVTVPYSAGTDRQFEGIIANGKNIRMSTTIDLTQLRYTISTVSVELINKSRLQDKEKLAGGWDGCAAKMYVWCEGLDWADIDPEGCIFHGIFMKTGHDLFSYRFTLTDFSSSKFHEIPEIIINASTWPNHRTDGGGGSVAGRPAPLIYGNLANGVELLPVDTDNAKFLVMAGISDSADADYTAGTETVYDNEGQVVDAGLYEFRPGGVDCEGNPCAFVAGVTFSLQLKRHQSTSGLAVDAYADFYRRDPGSDPEEPLRLNCGTAGQGTMYAFISLPKGMMDGNKIKLDWTGQDSSGSLNAYSAYIADGKYDRTSQGDFPYQAAVTSKGAGVLQNIHALSTSFARTTDTITASLGSSTEEYVTIFIKVNDGWTGHWLYADIYSLIITDADDVTLWSADFSADVHKETTGEYQYGTMGAGFIPDSTSYEPMSCSVKGPADISGEITGTADTLIEHPADVSRHIMQYHSDLNIEDIDVKSLGTMRALLPSAVIAMVVKASTAGGDILDRIYAQWQCARMVRIGGKLGVMTFDVAAIPKKSLKRTSDLLGETVTISRTPKSMICNKLTIKYDYNAKTGKYDHTLIKDHTNDADCARSYYKYGREYPVTVQWPDIRDEAQAELAATRYLNIYCYRHDLIPWTATLWDGWDLVEGDAANLTLIEGGSTDGSGWANEKCILLNRTITQDRIEQLWWRVRVE